MTAPDPFTADALWSAGEVREQSQQVPGQLDVWDVLAEVAPVAPHSGHYDCPDGPDAHEDYCLNGRQE